jgi:hypothetical protein
VGADDERGARPRQRADDVAQAAADGLESPVGEHRAQLARQPAELGRSRRALADGDLALDQLEGASAIEAVCVDGGAGGGRVAAAGGEEDGASGECRERS